MSLRKNLFVSTALFGLAACFLLHGRVTASHSSPSEGTNWIEVKIYRLSVDPRSSQPVVLLSDPEEARVMPIWIGPFEANALHSEMEGTPNIRPQTHDLLESIMQKTMLKLRRIVITRLEGSIYYASIWIESGDSTIEFDSRPSDALVMALKFKTPILISRDLFMDKSISLAKEKEEETEDDLWHEAPGENI